MGTLITDGQKKQYFRFVEDAAEKALKETDLDKDAIQKLIENGDKFQSRIVTAIQELSVSNKFADEEVESSYGYPSGYNKPKGITEQTNRLRELFPNIGFADEKLAEGTLPPNAEGWFAIPRWEKIASTYGEAVQKVLDLIKQNRNIEFFNYRKGLLGLQLLRQSQKSAKAFQKLGDEQKDYDILVVPAQFGLHHRDRSVYQAREVMNASEFGLGAFSIGIMILTHPERLMNHNDLWIDCAGDEFTGCGYYQFDRVPIFLFGDGKIKFFARRLGGAFDHYGSASAFLLQ
jgi:hypothetical protein